MVTAHNVSRRAVTVTAVIALAALAAAYYLIEPDSGIYPRCMFRELTGLDCPGCGSQRAIHALMHGRIGEAWDYNALLLAEIPLIGLLVIASAMRPSHPRLHALLNSRTVILTLLATVIIWTVIRNIP